MNPLSKNQESPFPADDFLNVHRLILFSRFHVLVTRHKTSHIIFVISIVYEYISLDVTIRIMTFKLIITELIKCTGEAHEKAHEKDPDP